MKTINFLYRWTQLSTGKWYIGSHCRKGGHPNDGYTCSSKYVKSDIISNPSDWIREILCIGDSRYIVELETKYLKSLNAKDNIQSYNGHNGDGVFSFAGMKHTKESNIKRSANNIGKHSGPKKPLTTEQRYKSNVAAKINGINRRGTKQTEKSNKQRSLKMKGIPRPQIIVTCTHCSKEGGENGMTRYHFDNCKKRIVNAS